MLYAGFAFVRNATLPVSMLRRALWLHVALVLLLHTLHAQRERALAMVRSNEKRTGKGGNEKRAREENREEPSPSSNSSSSWSLVYMRARHFHSIRETRMLYTLCTPASPQRSVLSLSLSFRSHSLSCFVPLRPLPSFFSLSSSRAICRSCSRSRSLFLFFLEFALFAPLSLARSLSSRSFSTFSSFFFSPGLILCESRRSLISRYIPGNIEGCRGCREPALSQ